MPNDATPLPPQPWPVIAPTCTCYLGDGAHNEDRGGVNHPVIPKLDAKGRIICQVHFPVDRLEYESRSFGDKDEFPRPT